MRKTVLTIAALLLASVCALRAQVQDWITVPMDASRTGVSIPNADNIDKAIGSVARGVYTAPNGRQFRGSVAQVAKLMIDAQPDMAFVKEVICKSSAPMERRRPQSEISNLIVDRLMICAAEKTGKCVDVGITNFGGIRTDLPQGEIILDDVLSMLPFKNYVTYVEVPGKELRRLFEQMAARRPEVVGGVKLTFNKGRLEEAIVQGRPLEDGRYYGVATVDFLLDGGDSINLARNARSLIITDCLMRDALLPYLRELGREGRELSYHLDDRITVKE
ncbi:MAG: 5'-nucleotidase C-terminal domain-containing protein [Bacteroidales bacterium]|nr:5'-nucleotidase C-terminal domain-containing protein [Bacteroidales bacterium]